MDQSTLRDNLESFCQMYDVSTRELLAALRADVAEWPDGYREHSSVAAEKIGQVVRALDPTDEYPDGAPRPDADEQAALEL